MKLMRITSELYKIWQPIERDIFYISNQVKTTDSMWMENSIKGSLFK